MPEEVNRVLTDHISEILFAPTQFALDNLANEGIQKGVYNVGDVRMDVVLNAVEQARPRQAALLDKAGFAPGTRFAVATIHRASNTDDEARLRGLIEVFDNAAVPLLLPVHPRLAKMLKTFNVSFGPNVHTIEPLGFLDLMAFMDAAAIVVTDSGGLQKEAYMLKRPAVTMRDTTEWIETIDAGWNRLCEPETAQFEAAVAAALGPAPREHPDLYGAYGVSERMVDVLEQSRSQA
jgi:UDP-N-acetylglucosamine 2-epimerase